MKKRKDLRGKKRMYIRAKTEYYEGCGKYWLWYKLKKTCLDKSWRKNNE